MVCCILDDDMFFSKDKTLVPELTTHISSQNLKLLLSGNTEVSSAVPPDHRAASSAVRLDDMQ